MLVGRLSPGISFLVIVVVDVPSDVNRAPLFRKKKKWCIPLTASWGKVESFKEFHEFVPLWTTSPSTPRVKSWHPCPVPLPCFSPCQRVALARGYCLITASWILKHFSTPKQRLALCPLLVLLTVIPHKAYRAARTSKDCPWRWERPSWYKAMMLPQSSKRRHPSMCLCCVGMALNFQRVIVYTE